MFIFLDWDLAPWNNPALQCAFQVVKNFSGAVLEPAMVQLKAGLNYCWCETQEEHNDLNGFMHLCLAFSSFSKLKDMKGEGKKPWRCFIASVL